MIKKAQQGCFNLQFYSSKFILSDLSTQLRIESEDLSNLGPTLENQPNILILNVKTQNEDDKYLFYLSTALAKLNNLKSLKIDLDARYVSQESIQNLIFSLTSCLKLSILDLSFTTLGYCKGIYSNGKSLIDLGSKLATLNKLSNLTLKLQHNAYVSKNIKDLGNNLVNFTNLTELNLILPQQSCDNDEYSEHFISNLSTALSNCKNLLTLKLDIYSVLGKLSNLGCALSKCTNLKTLTLCFSYPNNLNELPHLCSILAQNLQINAFTLNLEEFNYHLMFYSKLDTQSLYSALSNFKSLNYLNLDFSNRENSLDKGDFINLDLAIQNCSTFSFALNHIKFDEDIISYLNQALINNINLSKLKLYFDRYEIKTGDLKNLYPSLTSMANLSNLTLSFKYSKFDNEQVQFLGVSLEKIYLLSNLTLDISSTYVSDEGISFLGSALKNCSNLSILSLSFGENKIGDEGASGLGSGLANCINLSNLTLDLRKNKIGDESTSGLGSGLANCINLSNLTLNLYGNEIGDEGASGLGSGLANCINLSNLTLNLYKISDEDASGLGSGLANCINLSNLTLDLGKISDEGASGLGSGLANCINLSNLTLNLRSMNQSQQFKLKSKCLKSKRLVVFQKYSQ
ncbi:hypothetical protein TTHERM_00094090 (macronuclear) [Tetrahymena thermophila SB210]|uniref:Kinase domain protein n=1 Tax=Tetrahymena thermophila (strain SB210) TaxID=312017 RepID=Q235Y2_TETTS|nr:hypothetical protein TTHERM_00094090 [Tetrahymena thermophila SB210]EAR92618.3 hypothetical protein TTHERM_00094090 [Tetrahymena thermophila SB210]|eukprot:XP_001012863.3 hypothetical protein TTHERM_00094090 [Tetrahymena thermophila SB210]